MAPRVRSSHMNQNRFCPGVPNRYRISSRSSETRPKSMATVVVVLSGTFDRSSMPSLAAVMTASVVSGLISETAPTNVVFPTPKPPATTILTEVVGPAVRSGGLEVAKSNEHPFQKREVRLALGRVRLVDRDEAGLSHVADHHAGHAERHPHERGDLRERLDLDAQVAD